MAKLAGKYDTPEQLEAAYTALEQKLGQQGEQLGQLNTLVQQWKPWIEKAAPIVDWYGKVVTPNQDAFRSFIDSGFKGGAAPANGNQPTAGQVNAAAREVAQQQPGYEWLTPQEKSDLQKGIAEALTQQVITPFRQEFWGQAEKFGNALSSSLANQHRAFTDVMWRTLEMVTPKDQLDRVKAWHQESLKYAEPGKIDPMQMGRDMLDQRAELEGLRTKVKEYEEKSLAREKEAVPNLFGSVSPDQVSNTNTPAPSGREERFRAVLNDVQTEHGPEGVRVLFPSSL